MPAAVARRTRYDVPAWAEGFDLSSPAGFDAMAAHGEARKIESGTDPDTIDDPDVREHYLQLEQERFADAGADAGDDDSSGGGRDTSGARDGTVVHAPPPARRRSLRSAVGADVRSGGMFAAAGVDDAAGLLLGLVAYAVAISAFRDPVSATNGVRRWFAAKFFNQTTAGGVGPLTASPVDSSTAGLALLTAPITATSATPLAPAAPTNIGQLLRSGLPASVLAAPKPPAPAGAGL